MTKTYENHMSVSPPSIFLLQRIPEGVEAKTYHGRCHNDVGLITRLEPFVQIFRSRVPTKIFVGGQREVRWGTNPVVGGIIGDEDVRFCRHLGCGLQL